MMQACCASVAQLGAMLARQATAWSLQEQADDCIVPSEADLQVSFAFTRQKEMHG